MDNGKWIMDNEDGSARGRSLVYLCTMFIDREALERICATERRNNARYDALFAAHTNIIRGGGIAFNLEQLSSFITPEESQELLAIATERREIANRIWTMIGDMTEDL